MKAFRFETNRPAKQTAIPSGSDFLYDETGHRRVWIEALYRQCLALYPPRFRQAHGEEMVQTLRDALRDPAAPRPRLYLNLLTDLLWSVTKERYAMLQAKLGRRIFFFHASMLAGICTVLAVTICASIQQEMRQGANDPQVQMVRDAALLLEQGALPDAALPANRVNAAVSLAPFLIVYDEAGKPVASSATLDGRAPGPPAGVFDYARQHPEDTITWQPRHGLRFASIVKHVAGSHPGFVLAGRSLQEVEARKGIVGNLMLVGWAATMMLLFAGTVIFAWITGRSEMSTAV